MDKSQQTASKGALFARIYDLVRQIPRGQVSTYGQIARLAGCDARLVGWAMASTPADDIPWQRVINSQGKISLKGMGAQLQRQRLEAEGILFDERGRVDMERFSWDSHVRQET